MSNRTEQRAEMIKKITGTRMYLDTKDILIKKINDIMESFEGNLEAKKSMIYTLDSMSESLEEIGLLIGSKSEKVIDIVDDLPGQGY